MASIHTAAGAATRLIAPLIAASSGNRSVGVGDKGSSSRKRSSGGGAAAAAGVGLAPRAFDADRAAAPVLVAIDAGDLYCAD